MLVVAPFERGSELGPEGAPEGGAGKDPECENFTKGDEFALGSCRQLPTQSYEAVNTVARGSQNKVHIAGSSTFSEYSLGRFFHCGADARRQQSGTVSEILR